MRITYSSSMGAIRIFLMISFSFSTGIPISVMIENVDVFTVIPITCTVLVPVSTVQYSILYFTVLYHAASLFVLHNVDFHYG